MDIKRPKLSRIKAAIPQAVLIPIVTIIIMILSGIFYVAPTYQKLQTNKATLAAEQSEIGILKEKFEALKQQDEGALEQDLEELRVAVPELKNIPGLIAGIRKIADETNVSLDGMQVKPGKLASESAAQELTMKISVRGDLRNLNSFLNKISSVRRILGVQKFSASGGVIGSEELTSAMEITFYTLPLPGQLPKYSEKLPLIDKSKKDTIGRLAGYQVYTEGTSAVPFSSASPSPIPQAASPSAQASPAVRASAQPRLAVPATASATR